MVSSGPVQQGAAGRDRSLIHSLLLAASTYGVGQVANLLFQLLLLQQLGATVYGVVGLAHLLLISLMFLADLGYASLFLREDRRASQWLSTWRCALAHRLVATLVLIGLALPGWQLWSDDLAAQQYLFSAAPACLLALFNFSAPMIAGGQRLGGLLAAQIAWPAALLLWWPLSAGLALPPAVAAGLAVSLGYGVQAMANILLSRRVLFWIPLLGKGQIDAAMHLSVFGVLGTLHDRLTPFLLAPLAPGYMPAFLLLNHVLSGLSGVQGQLSRLLLGDATKERGRSRIVVVASLFSWGTVNMLLLGLLAQGLGLPADQRQWLALSALVVLIWGVSASSGLLTLLMIGARRESQVMRPFCLSVSVSVLLQLLAAWLGEASYLFWARLVGMLLLLAMLLMMLKLRPGPWGIAALIGALAACAAGNSSWVTGLALVLLVPALAGLLSLRPCYLGTLRTGLRDEHA